MFHLQLTGSNTLLWIFYNKEVYSSSRVLTSGFFLALNTAIFFIVRRKKEMQLKVCENDTALQQHPFLRTITLIKTTESPPKETAAVKHLRNIKL